MASARPSILQMEIQVALEAIRRSRLALPESPPSEAAEAELADARRLPLQTREEEEEDLLVRVEQVPARPIPP